MALPHPRALCRSPHLCSLNSCTRLGGTSTTSSRAGQIKTPLASAGSPLLADPSRSFCRPLARDLDRARGAYGAHGGGDFCGTASAVSRAFSRCPGSDFATWDWQIMRPRLTHVSRDRSLLASHPTEGHAVARGKEPALRGDSLPLPTPFSSFRARLGRASLRPWRRPGPTPGHGP